MHCHLGDFREYAALRRSPRRRGEGGVRSRSASRRAEAAVSLEALRIGDVIRIPAGRRAGWAVVVQPARTGKGTPIGPGRGHEDKQFRRLTLVDVPEAGRVGDARQGAAALQPEVAEVAPRPRDLAADRGAPRVRGLPAPPSPRGHGSRESERVARLRQELKAHPCHQCPDR
jgi:ATP-dependent RNA helicase HelY